MAEDLGYLLVGHGTRRVGGQAQLLELHRQVAPLLAPHITGVAFLELATPTIAEAIADLARHGCREVVIVPVLLFVAGHALTDIPALVEAAAADQGLKILRQTQALELAKPVLELSAQRFREAACQPRGSCYESGCEGGICPQVALAMIGRGSSSPEATQRMQQFTQRRLQLTPVARVVTGFVHAQHPNLESALYTVAEGPQAVAVVQPHLLFEGEVLEGIKAQVVQFQLRYPEKAWIVAATLGADRRLAATIAELARGEVSAEHGELTTKTQLPPN